MTTGNGTGIFTWFPNSMQTCEVHFATLTTWQPFHSSRYTKCKHVCSIFAIGFIKTTGTVWEINTTGKVYSFCIHHAVCRLKEQTESTFTISLSPYLSEKTHTTLKKWKHTCVTLLRSCFFTPDVMVWKQLPKCRSKFSKMKYLVWSSATPSPGCVNVLLDSTYNSVDNSPHSSSQTLAVTL